MLLLAGKAPYRRRPVNSALGVRLKRPALFAVLLSTLSVVSADPLKPDAWSQPRQDAFLKWPYRAADSSRPCLVVTPSSPPAGVRVVASTCAVSYVTGKPEQRERKIRLHIPGARWRGHTINSIEYEQQFSLTEGLVYHASMQFDLPMDSGKPIDDIKAWWRERGLRPARDGENTKDMVEREAGVEWVKPLGKLARFATEFYE